MKKQKDCLDYSLISKYRPLLMGVAILLILFCHLDVAENHNGMEHTHLAGILHTGTVGVDMFLLLSGVGLYYSYTKKPLPYWAFEKKRLLRILPYYFIIGGTTYLIYYILMKRSPFSSFLTNLFFITWFQGKSTRYWYVLTIVVFYLFFPVLYRFIRGNSHIFLKIMLFNVAWMVVIETLCYYVDIVNNLRIALTRLPIFIVGIYAGKLSYEKRPINEKYVVLYLVAGFILFAVQKRILYGSLEHYLYYPIRGALSVSIITSVILIMEQLEKNNWSWIFNRIANVLIWFGGLTYELYLLHQSYLILFEFPGHPFTYFIVAFILPTITAAGIYLGREALKTRTNT